MMTTRLALGSVSTLAAAALLLGAAPYLFNRVMGPAHVAPWGAISPLSIGQSEAADGDQAKLLKLAALKTGSDTAATQPIAATPTSETSPVSAATSIDTAPSTVPPAANAATANVANENANEPVQVAAIDPTPDVSRTETRTTNAAGGMININTASSDALDRLPGVGRVGHAIVSHRPYRAVNDLVRKRVLRMSDFQRIQAHVRID